MRNLWRVGGLKTGKIGCSCRIAVSLVERLVDVDFVFCRVLYRVPCHHDFHLRVAVTLRFRVAECVDVDDHDDLFLSQSL